MLKKVVVLTKASVGVGVSSIEFVEAKETEKSFTIGADRYTKKTEPMRPSLLASRGAYTTLSKPVELHDPDSDYIREIYAELRNKTIVKQTIAILNNNPNSEQIEALAKIFGLDKLTKFER